VFSSGILMKYKGLLKTLICCVALATVRQCIFYYTPNGTIFARLALNILNSPKNKCFFIPSHLAHQVFDLFSGLGKKPVNVRWDKSRLIFL